MRVTGVVASFLDLATNAGSPTLYPTSAFFQAHQTQLASDGPIVMLDLVHDAEGLPALRRGLEAAAGDGPTSDVGTREDLSIDFEQAAGVQARALLIFAALAALAGIVAVGQALSRHLARTVPPRLITASVGMTRPQHVAIGLLETLPVAVGGALVATLLAAAASPLLPMGLSRQAEPNPGVTFDALVILPGALFVGIVILGRGGLSAWTLSRRGDRSTVTARTSALCTMLARHRTPAPLVIGVGMALPRQPAPMGAAARGTLMAAIVSTTLLAGIFTFIASLDRLVSTPARYGAPFDRATTEAMPAPVARAQAAELAQRPGVGGVTVLDNAQITALDTQVAAASVKGVGGAPRVTVTAGRLPRSQDEVFMGSAVLRNFGFRVGQTLDIADETFTIVGNGLLPAIGDLDPAKIALFTPDGLRAADGRPQGAYLWFDDDSPDGEATRWAEEHVGPTAAPAPPEVVRNLADIDRTPLLLAVFVSLLAAAALVHLTVTTVRWRRRELAVLRVIGFSGHQVRSTVAWQARVPVLLGLLVGLPVGVAIGRWTWVLVARGPGAPEDPLVPIAALVLLVPAALVCATLVAALPGRAAARVQPAIALRSG